MPPTIHRLIDAEAVAQFVAADLVAAVRGGAADVCLTGGTTPLRAYALLDGLHGDWRGVRLWYGDERCVPYDDPDSNHGEVHRRFAATGADWHPMPGVSGPDEGAREYAAELGATRLDVLHLGLGPDGHVASLFPRHPLLGAETTTAGIADAPKPPPARITLTLPTLNAARRIVLLVTGGGKAEALARALGDPTPDVPASLLRRDDLEVVADEAALALVPE